ncbi:hypothetical protein [Trabulsiella guamensis]|uniref:hypothetical protein n=1 Tax=Trabulsiella guamensis TaxID=158852 RepID=UPI00056F05AF|nr:hypothetical protein [Trabulsiella guamensis]
MFKKGDKAIDVANGQQIEIVDVRQTKIAIAGDLSEYGCKYLTGPDKGHVRYLPVARVKK